MAVLQASKDIYHKTVFQLEVMILMVYNSIQMSQILDLIAI